MASRCLPDLPPDANDFPQQEPVVPQAALDAIQVEYDFLEQPSQDFFCPVSLELLTDPHQTTCCGNHLSQEAADRLKRDGKPCPMCKEPQLATMPDKFYKRRVNEIMVHCPHKKSGCEWVGGVNDVKQHSDSCPKRPWKCWHCGFESTYDIGVNEHLPVCTKYPIVCPNSCEVGSVARCDLEAHLMECPLQPVTCEYAEVGCDVKVPRRDLDRHMKEDQQQHLLSATLLNLRLTRKTEITMAELKQQLATKDDKIDKLTQAIAARDLTIVELQGQLKHDKEVLQQDFEKREEEMDDLMEEKEIEHVDELATRDQQITEKNEAIIDLQKQLDQVQDELMHESEEKNRMLQEKAKERKSLKTQLTKKGLAFEEELAKKDHKFQDLKKELHQQVQMIEEKSAQHVKELKERDRQIKDKNQTIADLQKQLKRVQVGLEAKVTDLQQQVVKYGKDTQEHLKQQDKRVEHLLFGQLVSCDLALVHHGFTVHDFTLIEFKKCQAWNDDGDWYSEPFYSHQGGYKFELNICTNGNDEDRGVYMSVWFKLVEGDHDDELAWPVSTTAHVQLLNQLGDNNHHKEISHGQWNEMEEGEDKGGINQFIELAELELGTTTGAQYLKNDCLLFRVYMKAEPA